MIKILNYLMHLRNTPFMTLDKLTWFIDSLISCACFLRSFIKRSSSNTIVMRFPMMKTAFRSFIPSVFFQILKSMLVQLNSMHNWNFFWFFVSLNYLAGICTLLLLPVSLPDESELNQIYLVIDGNHIDNLSDISFSYFK